VYDSTASESINGIGSGKQHQLAKAARNHQRAASKITRKSINVNQWHRKRKVTNVSGESVWRDRASARRNISSSISLRQWCYAMTVSTVGYH